MKIRSLFDSDMRQQSYDQLLDRVGLQRQGSHSHKLAAVGLFGLGVVVGMSMGMLFAPKRGEELRSEAIARIPGIRRGAQRQEPIYEQTL